MKNKLFPVVCFSVLALVSLFFIILIFLLITQLQTTTSTRELNREEIFFAVKLSLLTATVSSILALIISLPISYALTRHNFPFKDTIDTLLFLPIVVSPVALGAMLLIFFNTSSGRFIEEHIGRVVFEVPAVILAQFIVVLGFTINLVKSTFEHINPEYENISRTLGATKFQSFTKILMPLSKKGILSAFLLTWARAIGEFGATVMLAGAITMKTETLTVAIFLSFASADIHGACIFILISLATSLAALFLVRKIYAFR